MRNTSALIRNFIDRDARSFDDMSDTIWKYAENRFQEHRSCRLQKERLHAEGFRITENLAGMDTAFMAEWGRSGPVIGILGEYDALPGLSQEADFAEPQPIPGQECGHGCGHHLLGTAAVQAAVSVRRWLEMTGTPGRIRFYATPAEEGSSGKTFMLRAGCFKDLDICISWHPDYRKGIGGSTLASMGVAYRFSGVSAHAAVNPHLGRSALDAVELMNVGCNYLREHIIPEARLHYAITDSGGSMPNVVQAHAEVRYSIRAPHSGDLADIFHRVENVAKGAALMTGTLVESRPFSYYADYLDNNTLNQLTKECMDAIVDENYSEEELSYARRFQSALPEAWLAENARFAAAYMPDRGSSHADSPIALYEMPAGHPKPPSSDLGNVSWIVPCVCLNTACYAAGTALHSWQATAQGCSALAHHGRTNAAAAMALIAAELYRRPLLISQAEKDLIQARGGESYKCLLPDDVAPEGL